MPLYWIVDPERRVIEVYRLAAGTYDAPQTLGDDMTDVPPFTDVRFDPTALWRR